MAEDLEVERAKSERPASANIVTSAEERARRVVGVGISGLPRDHKRSRLAVGGG